MGVGDEPAALVLAQAEGGARPHVGIFRAILVFVDGEAGFDNIRGVLHDQRTFAAIAMKARTPGVAEEPE